MLDRALKVVRPIQADIVDADTYKEYLDQHHEYFLSLIHIYEEDRHAAPENLQVSYSLMYRGDILYQDAPHDHHHRQPAVDRICLLYTSMEGSIHQEECQGEPEEL